MKNRDFLFISIIGAASEFSHHNGVDWVLNKCEKMIGERDPEKIRICGYEANSEIGKWSNDEKRPYTRQRALALQCIVRACRIGFGSFYKALYEVPYRLKQMPLNEYEIVMGYEQQIKRDIASPT